MSLEDLDALLNTPVGKKVKKKKKGRKKSRASGVGKGRVRKEQSDAIMSRIESAQERINNWRLSADPTVTLLIVQHTTCTGCGTQSSATISPPMTGFTDRLGRTHYKPTFIPLRTLPIKIKRTTISVPICHECALSAPTEQRICHISSSGEAQMDERQLSLPFREKSKANLPSITASICSDLSQKRDLVPLHQTPQVAHWIFQMTHPQHQWTNNEQIRK